MSFTVPPRTAVTFAGRNARTIDGNELDRILTLHAAFMARAPGGRRAILKFVNLSGCDLSGRCLAEADLSGALLQHANLAGINLRDATLFGADLTRCDLTEACLERADLRGATLRDAMMPRCNMVRIDLREGMLLSSEGGNLRRMHADGGTAMHGAVLTGAKMQRARLSNVVLTQADLHDVDLRGSMMTRANLSKADLTGCNMHGVDLSGAIMTGAILAGTILTEASLAGAQLEGAYLLGALLDGANLSNARMDNAILPRPLERNIQEILRQHARWIKSDGETGERADLSGADLTTSIWAVPSLAQRS